MLTTKLRRRMLVVTVWCLGMFGPLCLAQDVALPEAIKESLSRYADLKTMSMNWTQRYHPSDLARKRLAKSKIQYLSQPRDQYLVWQNGYLYGRTKIGEDTNEFAFDGRIVAGGRFGTVRGNDRVLRKDLATDLDVIANYFAVEELQYLGIQLPYGMARVVAITQQAQLEIKAIRAIILRNATECRWAATLLRGHGRLEQRHNQQHTKPNEPHCDNNARDL